MVRERESAALAAAVPADARLATSGVSTVEVTRALRVAGLEKDLEQDLADLLGGCVVLDIDSDVLRSAAALASDALRPLDAIHLATALAIAPEIMFVYDRQLGRAARELGIRVEAPGTTAQ
ncbi:MAG: PIN domain-containing protein [Actinomycetota bacterium]|nr:PIN domain-containing protein [Actinomycetota bacterium]MDQ3424761.1 PIN domain-containing protein [Actinomycetota bacterium]